jgi:glycosyltransferase involved in cell wall biosynthesis
MNGQSAAVPEIAVVLLSSGGDKPYTFGLATELVLKGATVDLIGSDNLDCPELRTKPRLTFVNLRGDQRYNAGLAKKVTRIVRYYFRLIRYAAVAKPRIFHILWNNKFETFDRTLLLSYYKLLGKRIVLTTHDVNQSKMHSKDSCLNRLTLRIQYRLADHIFVHNDKAKIELIQDFGVREIQITVIPFGINNWCPISDLTPNQAKEQLGLRNGERTILFFGRIAPYKGLEYLFAAFRRISAQRDGYRLIIAGSPDLYEKYWNPLLHEFREDVQAGRILLRPEFIPDEQTEIYFKAADVLVLPYRQIYQSGVLLLARSFGLPVLAADVGSLRDDVVEDKTGFVFKPENPAELATAIERYFASDLFASLNNRRQEIRDYAAERHSWDTVGKMTLRVYASLLQLPLPGSLSNSESPKVSVGA